MSKLILLILILSTSIVWGATPSSGTVSQAGHSHAWSGGPFTAVSPSPGTCVEAISCDTFTLTVTIPSDKVAQLHIRISWVDATNDLDLFLFDSQGQQWDFSTSGDRNFEEIRSTVPAGNYRVVTNAFLSANSVYSGAVTLESITDPPPPPDFGTKITFSNNTMADFSATSGEPFIRADLKDNIFVSVPFGVSTTVSLLWKSSDGGRTFIPLGSPITRDAVTGAGGGDTHQDFDADNNLYYVDLSAACVTAAVSTDEGNTFPPDRTNQLVCVSEENPDAIGDDRQWVGAFGSEIGYVTWRNLAAGSFWIFKTTDGGRSWDNGTLMGEVDQSGPYQVDKTKRMVTVDGATKEAILSYQIYYSGTELRVFRVSDFNDGSPLKIDDLSIVDPGASVSSVFPILTVDTAGNLYAVWSQSATEIYMATSVNRGNTWSKPVRVSNVSGTNIMPWAVAGDPGRINVVWYRSPVKGNPNTDVSAWEIYMAQSLDALKAKPRFQQVQVSQNVIHRGEICLQGLNCDIAVPMRDRSFLEFPSVALDSKGAAIITFNDNTNQVEAPYVMVSKQITGPSLYKSTGSIKYDAARFAPETTDIDETGDARFPDHGLLTGANIPALDIRSVSFKDSASTLTVTMEVVDLSLIALNSATGQSGGDGLLYLVQWDFDEDIYWVAAEIRAGQPVFYTGTLGLIRSGTSKKFITYNPDLTKSIQIQGQVSNTIRGKITFNIPRALAGNPPKGARFWSATGYAMSERGPLLPVGVEQIPNPSSLPVKVDASAAINYTVVN